MYRRLSAQLALARREGRFPDLIDTVREVHVPPAWPDANAFVAEIPGWFRLDRTEGQEHALYVAAEKDTLRQQLTGWLADAGIPVLVVRGFGSQSYADAVHDRVTADPRDGVLLVVGDFDCSGEDIERDWVARTGCWSHTERVLLTYEQVRAYELPSTEGKHGDPRWPAFAARYGFDPQHPVQWEVEALEPADRCRRRLHHGRRLVVHRRPPARPGPQPRERGAETGRAVTGSGVTDAGVELHRDPCPPARSLRRRRGSGTGRPVLCHHAP
ncbi:hypothetical protein ACFY4K_33990 [Streptomyces leeuwenhoekii]|uniref:hypothetical protein n=1 Tax=Streptomyces leeuwenhoekii TaxID=1437453 RepID=UPI00368D60F8